MSHANSTDSSDQNQRINGSSLGARFLRKIRERGMRDALKRAYYRAYERFREWRLGIRTTGLIHAHQLGHDPACHNYDAASYRCLDQALAHLKDRIDEVVLLDYGAGKGRVLAVAGTFPFRRLIGIELSPELSAIAENNIRCAWKKLACRDIEIITEDATQYVVPPDVNAVFMFNPFSGDVFDQVEQRLLDSIEKTPRRLTLFFLYPPHRDDNPFESRTWLRQTAELPTGDDQLRMLIFESNSRY